MMKGMLADASCGAWEPGVRPGVANNNSGAHRRLSSAMRLYSGWYRAAAAAMSARAWVGQSGVYRASTCKMRYSSSYSSMGMGPLPASVLHATK